VSPRFNQRRLKDLDFQRVSIPEGSEQLGDQQAEPDIEWLNIEPAGTQRRAFLQRLPPGFYKFGIPARCIPHVWPALFAFDAVFEPHKM
jgi:hypothetical protein